MAHQRLLNLAEQARKTQEEREVLELDSEMPLSKEEIAFLESLGFASDHGTIPYKYEEKEKGVLGGEILTTKDMA